jgi:hypothetical protein
VAGFWPFTNTLISIGFDGTDRTAARRVLFTDDAITAASNYRDDDLANG